MKHGAISFNKNYMHKWLQEASIYECKLNFTTQYSGMYRPVPKLIMINEHQKNRACFCCGAGLILGHLFEQKTAKTLSAYQKYIWCHIHFFRQHCDGANYHPHNSYVHHWNKVNIHIGCHDVAILVLEDVEITSQIHVYRTSTRS